MSEKKPFGVKLSEDEYQRAHELAEASGMQKKDWFIQLMSLYEANALKENFKEFGPALTELQVHTDRMYQIVVNMIQQSNHLRDSETKDLLIQISNRSELVDKLQEELRLAKEEIAKVKNDQKLTDEENDNLKKSLDELQKNVENTQLLINEYKEKNDNLNGLLVQYKEYEVENKTLKSQFESEKQSLIEANQLKLDLLDAEMKELASENQVLQDQNKELSNALKATEAKSEQDLDLHKKECEIKVKEAKIEVKEEYQQKLEALLDKQQAKIEEIQDDFKQNKIAYEAKIQMLEEQLSALKSAE